MEMLDAEIPRRPLKRANQERVANRHSAHFPTLEKVFYSRLHLKRIGTQTRTQRVHPLDLKQIVGPLLSLA